MNFFELTNRVGLIGQWRERVLYLYNPLFFVGGTWLTVGIMVAVATDSCVTAWVGIEINLVGLIGVFAVRESLRVSVKIKYFVVQCIASSIFLAGVLSVKAGERKRSSWLALLARAMVQFRLFIKIGVFPLHT